jgi:flagellar basal-body rod protein FlgB
VNAITDSAIIAALGRQMNRAVARESVASGNLANADTPGYRTREVTFADTLDGELGDTPMVRTAANHLGTSGAPAADGTVRESTGLAMRRDGNNVQLDRELVNLTLASSDFSAAQTALAAKFRLVRYAINEGR